MCKHVHTFRDFDDGNFERVFDDTFYFSRPSNRVSTPGRFFAAMTQAMISRQRGLFSLVLRASRRKDEALGGGNPILPRRTERRECVESISVTAGHEPPRGFRARSILIFHASVNGDKVSRWGPAERWKWACGGEETRLWRQDKG